MWNGLESGVRRSRTTTTYSQYSRRRAVDDTPANIQRVGEEAVGRRFGGVYETKRAVLTRVMMQVVLYCSGGGLVLSVPLRHPARCTRSLIRVASHRITWAVSGCMGIVCIHRRHYCTVSIDQGIGFDSMRFSRIFRVYSTCCSDTVHHTVPQ